MEQEYWKSNCKTCKKVIYMRSGRMGEWFHAYGGSWKGCRDGDSETKAEPSGEKEKITGKEFTELRKSMARVV